MIIEVKTTPKAKKNLVKDLGNNKYKVYVTSAPEDGKANKAVIKLLAEFFAVSRSSVRMVKGETARNKIVEILK